MKRKILLCLIPIATMALVSCNKNNHKEDPSNKGYVQAEMKMVSSDLRSSYAPSKGEAKLLVIPISFDGETGTGYKGRITKWTTSRLNTMNKYYFSENDSLSLASYYHTASIGQLTMSGMVTDVYSNTTKNASDILADDSLETLWDMMEDAINWVLDTYTDVDWSEYDLNRDGCFDNIHLITNYTSNTWADPLWPHMFYTERKGTLERPMANVYSISGIGFVSDSITAIHEQGHIFGLEDYYDYSRNGTSTIDYIGGLDMQSHNCLDWNSFSKLSMGWVKPYVVTGEKEVTTITMSAASLNGDCLLIPADYSTWNGSAFDEYILLELLAPFGNNALFDDYSRYIGRNAGIRLYHVDARTYGSDMKEPSNNECLVVDDLETQQINFKEDVSKYKYNCKGANNCSNWLDYEGGIRQLRDHPLLTLIQKGNNFTFSRQNQRNTLNRTDLFYEGDVFTFEKYSHFMNKSDFVQELTDKGEVFPYEISIGEIVDNKEVTITVTKVK